MTSFEEAQQRANEIAQHGFTNMFVTISLGCEYCNSYDVEPDMAKMTTEEKVKTIQKRLNELGANPQLKEDGVMGRVTMSAILEALKPVK